MLACTRWNVAGNAYNGIVALVLPALEWTVVLALTT